MTPDTVTIFTPTYNKPRHLLEAARSVLNQSYPHWRWWIVLDGPIPETQRAAQEILGRDPRVRLTHCETTPEQREAAYRPAVLFNECYPQITTSHVLWLSDDDLLKPKALERLLQTLRETGDECVYGRCEVIRERDGRHMRTLPVDSRWSFGPGGTDPCNKLDGGQVLHTMQAWRELGWRSPTDRRKQGVTECVDGHFLRALSARYRFACLPEVILTHRCTELSEHNRGQRA